MDLFEGGVEYLQFRRVRDHRFLCKISYFTGVDGQIGGRPCAHSLQSSRLSGLVDLILSVVGKAIECS